MCVQGNSAPLSVRYINAQLSALWENAAECVHTGENTSFVDIKSEEYDKHKYTRALAEFHLLGLPRGKGPFAKDDLFFNASFDKPRLEFACNHEAVLHLKLKDGHLNKAYKKVKELGYRLNRSHNVPFKGLEIAFRMRFDRHSIQGKSSKIGNQAVVQFMILDFSSAKMVVTRPDRDLSMSHDILDALEFYMRQYLTFLHGAGAHTLFDLPDFDDDKYSPHIDHSINSVVLDVEELCQDITVFETSISSINDHLRNAWMKVGSRASGIFGTPPVDQLSTCLYEIKSTWLSYTPSTHFHIKFSPPTVRALCSHEVVVYYTLEELSFFETEVFKNPCGGYSDWEDDTKWQIAFIVDVKEAKEADGCVTRIMLDLKSARFSKHLSVFHCYETAAIEYFNLIVEFMKTKYMALLAEYKFHDIYSVDTRASSFIQIVESESSDEEWADLKPEKEVTVTSTWTVTEEQITLGGFDEVLAISEESINALIKSWWVAAKGSEAHCLSGFTSEHSFQVTFRPARIQLLSGNRAIIWVTIDEGRLLLGNNDNTYDCSSWSMAYEVDIKLAQHHDMKFEALDERITNSSIITAHGHGEDRHIRHVIFDFANAQLSYELSYLDGIFDNGPNVAIQCLASMMRGMSEYLQALTRSGHHIIHSLPIFKEDTTFGLTDVGVQVVAKASVTVQNVNHVHEPPVLLLLGMKARRPLPATTLAWGAGWVIPERPGPALHSTIYLSKQVFLEAHLLRLLEHINRRTAVIPRFPNPDEDEHKIYLTTWDQHLHRRNKECEWTLSDTRRAGWLEYIFDHKEARESSREMSGATPDELYSVLCHTRNQLLIPTTHRPECLEIVMRGRSILSLRGKTPGGEWSNRTTAQWEASIRIHTSANGLRVEVSKHIAPEWSKPQLEGRMSLLDALQLHRLAMPEIVKLDEMLGELKALLEDVWESSYPSGTCYTLASPVFTSRGDLVIQAFPRDLRAKRRIIRNLAPTLTVNPTLPAFETPPLTPSPFFTQGGPLSAAAYSGTLKVPVPPAAGPQSPVTPTKTDSYLEMAKGFILGEKRDSLDPKSGSSSATASEANSPPPATPAALHSGNPLNGPSKTQNDVRHRVRIAGNGEPMDPKYLDDESALNIPSGAAL